MHALRTLARVAVLRDDVDLSDDVQQIVGTLLDELDSDDPMDMDGEDGRGIAKDDMSVDVLTLLEGFLLTMHCRVDNTFAAASEALLAAVNAKSASVERELQASMQQVARIKHTSVTVQRSSFQAMTDLFKRLTTKAVGDRVAPDDIARLVAQVLFGYEVGSEAIRLLRAECLASIATTSPSLATALRSDVEESVRQERSAAVRDRLSAYLATLHS